MSVGSGPTLYLSELQELLLAVIDGLTLPN